MKRRRSRRWCWIVLAGVLESVCAFTAWGQRDVTVEGAIFLLRPIGARAVGVGHAVVARRDGSEAVWWNPAGLASATRREVAIHHSQDFIATGDAISVIVPSSILGVIGLSADIQDYGPQENTPPSGEPAVGTILPRSFVLSATYATPIGSRMRSGVAFKVVQLRFDCSGPCQLPTSVAQTFALDAGIQYSVGRTGRLSLGASVRNVGLPLQVEDSPQADPLPSRVQLGAQYHFPIPSRYAESTDVNLSVDIMDGLEVASPLPRVGAEFVWQKRAFIRGGYVFEPSESGAGGPSVGLGLISRNVSIDIARVFTGYSADAGQAPTYLSLRVEF